MPGRREYRTSEQLKNRCRQQVRDAKDASIRALNYEPYTFHNITDIDTMSLQCSNCGILNLIRRQMDCAAQKAKFSCINSHNFILFCSIYIYEGINSHDNHFLGNMRKYNSVFQSIILGVLRSLWVDSTHPLEYRARSTTLLAVLFPPKVSLTNLP